MHLVRGGEAHVVRDRDQETAALGASGHGANPLGNKSGLDGANPLGNRAGSTAPP
jgi:hypothetical protein